MRRRVRAVFAGLGLLLGCQPSGPEEPDLRALRLPTGLALSPAGDWMFVSNGNWDRRETGSTLVTLDMTAFEAAVEDAGSPGSALGEDRPCRRVIDEGRVECDESNFIDPDDTILLASGAGNIAFDRPAGEGGLLRLLVPSRIDPELTWIDVSRLDSTNPEMDCGQLGDRACDSAHRLAVADDPASVAVDTLGHRFAYLPHLLEDEECDGDDCAGVTLIALDGEFGPNVVDVERDFFRLDPIHDSGLRGGFAIAQRACDVDSGNAPSESSSCERPVLYVSQRFWAGVRVFRVAAGLDWILPGRESSILGVNVDAAAARPLMGDLEFEDPATGERLLIVHTTPPGLARVDTRLDGSKTPVDDVLSSVSVCNNPNMLAVHRPADAEWLAFVSCYGDDKVAIVGLASFSVVETIDLGSGTNEMLVDEDRKWLYVANTLEHTISVIELDRSSPQYLEEVAVLGLGSEREATAG